MGVTTMKEKAPLKKRRSGSRADEVEDPGSMRGAADPEELEFKEFCEADSNEVEASPEFKEDLRKKLMQLVKNLYGVFILLVGALTHYN